MANKKGAADTVDGAAQEGSSPTTEASSAELPELATAEHATRIEHRLAALEDRLAQVEDHVIGLPSREDLQGVQETILGVLRGQRPPVDALDRSGMPEILRVRTDGRARHVCAAGTFGPEWKEVTVADLSDDGLRSLSHPALRIAQPR